MRQIYTFLIIALVVIAGFISVPRCYVMQPDCPERNTQLCPLESSSASTQSTGHDGYFCYALDLEQQPPCSQKPSPTKKLSRFKIDQFHNIAEIDISAPTESSLQHNVNKSVTRSYAPTVVSLFLSCDKFHSPPFPIILQKQSFLI